MSMDGRWCSMVISWYFQFCFMQGTCHPFGLQNMEAQVGHVYIFYVMDMAHFVSGHYTYVYCACLWWFWAYFPRLFPFLLAIYGAVKGTYVNCLSLIVYYCTIHSVFVRYHKNLWWVFVFLLAIVDTHPWEILFVFFL